MKKWQILCMFSCFVQFVQMQKMRKIVRLTGADGMRILKPHQNHRQCIRMQFLLPAMDISKFRGRFSAQDSSFDEKQYVLDFTEKEVRDMEMDK